MSISSGTSEIIQGILFLSSAIPYLHKEKTKNYFWFTLFCNTFVTHNFLYLLHNIKIIWICSVLKEINGSDMEFKVFGYQINICEWRAKIPQTILIGLSQTIDAEPTPI